MELEYICFICHPEEVSLATSGFKRMEELAHLIKNREVKKASVLTAVSAIAKESGAIVGKFFISDYAASFSADFMGDKFYSRNAENAFNELLIRGGSSKAQATILVSGPRETYYTAKKAAENIMQDSTFFKDPDSVGFGDMYVLNRKKKELEFFKYEGLKI